jgi:hypothetical protein
LKPAIAVSGATITRARVEELLAEQALPAFEECDFQQADLRQVAELVRALGLNVG